MSKTLKIRMVILKKIIYRVGNLLKNKLLTLKLWSKIFLIKWISKYHKCSLIFRLKILQIFSKIKMFDFFILYL